MLAVIVNNSNSDLSVDINMGYYTYSNSEHSPNFNSELPINIDRVYCTNNSEHSANSNSDLSINIIREHSANSNSDLSINPCPAEPGYILPMQKL